MSIKQWPANERPREKLLQQGAKSLSNAELLAIFLRTGVRGKTALDLAREMLKTFGSLSKLLSTPLEIFQKIPGLGKSKFVALQASLELSRRYFFEQTEQQSPFDTQTAQTYFKTQLMHREQEILAALFLNNKHKLIAYEEILVGSIDRAEFYPREIIKAALKHNAAAMIIAHNHTSGDPTPSLEDHYLTKHLEKLLEILDIQLLDHYIIGRSNARSIMQIPSQDTSEV